MSQCSLPASRSRGAVRANLALPSAALTLRRGENSAITERSGLSLCPATVVEADVVDLRRLRIVALRGQISIYVCRYVPRGEGGCRASHRPSSVPVPATPL